jgi:hypothetical protein
VVSAPDIGESVTSLSCCAWVKKGAAAGVLNEYILSHWQPTGNQRSWSMFASAGSRHFDVSLSLDGSAIVKWYRVDNALADSAWHHLGFSFNNGVLKLYVDGTERTTVKNTDLAGASILNSTGTVTIGGLVGGNFANVSIDDARVYNAVLSDADFLLLAAGGEPTTAPVAHWTLDDGPQYGEPSNGDPIAVWGGRNGINFTQTTTSARPTFLQSGANGRPGITFDGVDDFLRIANAVLSGTSGTVVVVSKQNASGAGVWLGSADEGTATSYWYVGHLANGSHALEQRNAGDAADAISSLSAGGTAAARIDVVRSDGATSSARLNGVNHSFSTISAGANNGDWVGDTTLLDNTAIGASVRNTVSLYTNSTIYEVLAYDRCLSDAELRKVERKLASRYGITLAG